MANLTINQIADEQVSAILNKYHAFFAFSNQQFDEQATKCFIYARLPHGMFAPKAYANSVISEVLAAYDEARKAVQSQESKKDRIWYEFANHECQISMDYSDALAALLAFDDITEQDVHDQWPAYFNHCVDNDYF